MVGDGDLSIGCTCNIGLRLGSNSNTHVVVHMQTCYKSAAVHITATICAVSWRIIPAVYVVYAVAIRYMAQGVCKVQQVEHNALRWNDVERCGMLWNDVCAQIIRARGTSC